MESAGERQGGLELRLIGPLVVSRDGVEQRLPPSRKVRALLGYLALARGPVRRGELCEMLWEVPSDPRSELRWCLSKIRALVDEPQRRRLHARDDSVALDLSDCSVDVRSVLPLPTPAEEPLGLDEIRRRLSLFRGELLEGVEIDHSPLFDTWIVAQRRRLGSCRASLLELLAARSGGEEALEALEMLVRQNPFDLQVQERLMVELVRRGRLREGEQHLEAAVKLFESDAVDPAPLRSVWRRSRVLHAAGGVPSDPLLKAEPGVPRAMAAEPIVPSATPRRASIAIIPFAGVGPPSGNATWLPAALAHDVITRLAKLRTLFVIAQGSVLALHERQYGAQDSARMLGVDYVVGGTLLQSGERLVVQAELLETQSTRVVWAETFDTRLQDALAVLEGIGNRIVSSVIAEIEALERHRAVLKAPSSLDAWEAYHRGLWHMYRFTPDDNGQARHFFAQAVRLDPTFSRAFAGLSFTHWQDAFQGWAADPRAATELAQTLAGQSLEVDDRDPAAHWAMGRALWLRGRLDESITELEQAVHLSPNFALAHYNLAFVHSTTGDPSAAIGFSDQSRELSPFDPMLFGMFGSRAMALVRLGRFDEAADWGLRAATRPNAAAHIRGIAAFSLALADRLDEARALLGAIRADVPGYRFADFQRAFRFEASASELFRKGARRLGVD
ncbi:tetratricopeptide repeat protein [Alsobacter sp. R-9]